MVNFGEIPEFGIGYLWSLSWQISLLVAFVWVVSSVSRKASPNFRYWLWFIVLIRLCLPVQIVTPYGCADTVKSVIAKADAFFSDQAQWQPETSDSAEVVRYPPQQAMTNELDISAPASDSVVLSSAPATVSPREEPNGTTLVFRGWVCFVLLFGLLLVYRTIRVRRWVERCPEVDRPDLQQSLQSGIDALQIKQNVSLRSVDDERFPGPVVVGLFRPTILLPQQVIRAWSINEIEPVLLHELAHVKRRDLLVNWLQIIVQVLYFFHPLVWFANWKMRQERESACDDLALAHLNHSRKCYCESILRVLEEARRPRFAFGLAGVGLSERSSSIGRRILRILNGGSKLQPQLALSSIGLIIILALASVVVAGDNSQDEPKDVGLESESRFTGDLDKRLTTYSDEKSFLLGDGETYGMKVKPNIARVDHLQFTAHIVAEGTKFDIDGFDNQGKAIDGARIQLPAIHDGVEERCGISVNVDGTPILCKVQLTPERRDKDLVNVDAKVLFTKTPTPQEIEALLATRGKEGQMHMDFRDMTRLLIQHKQRYGHYPKDLGQLKAELPKDVYSPSDEDYRYEANRRRFILSSCGEDGIYGNDDDEFYVNHRTGARTGKRHELFPLEGEDIVQEQNEYLGPTQRRPQGDASIGGMVVDAVDNEPVDYATVYLFYVGTNDAIFINVASDGSFEFKDIPAGTYSLTVINTAGYQHAAYDPEKKGGQYPRFEIKEKERIDGIVFKLEKAWSISGLILTEEGNPPPSEPSTTVLAWAQKKETERDRYEIVAQVNANPEDGSYYLNGLDNRPIYVMALDFGPPLYESSYPPIYYPGTFARDEATLLSNEEGGNVENVNFQLQRIGGLILEGTVTSADSGEPISNAVVVAHHQDMLFDRAMAYTDGEGHYRFECLGPGEFLVHVDATPWDFVRKRKVVTIAKGEETTHLDFALKTGVSISGTLVDSASQPWPWKEPTSFGSASIKKPSDELFAPSFSGVRNKYQGAPDQNVTFFHGEGDYDFEDMIFPGGNSFVIKGMAAGDTVLAFDPLVEGKEVVKILHDGKDLLKNPLKTEPGQDVEGVTFVIGSSSN